MAATFPGIDRDVAVTGALLHDIGKIDAYEQTGGAIDLSDAGKLAGRDPARLLPRAARDRGDRGLPAGARRGRAAHRPQPPRQARARQPGHPVHARGHARAHDRQPRRHARQLRPDREGPRRGRALVRASTARSPARRTSAAPPRLPRLGPITGPRVLRLALADLRLLRRPWRAAAATTRARANSAARAGVLATAHTLDRRRRLRGDERPLRGRGVLLRRGRGGAPAKRRPSPGSSEATTTSAAVRVRGGPGNGAAREEGAVGTRVLGLGAGRRQAGGSTPRATKPPVALREEPLPLREDYLQQRAAPCRSTCGSPILEVARRRRRPPRLQGRPRTALGPRRPARSDQPRDRAVRGRRAATSSAIASDGRALLPRGRRRPFDPADRPDARARRTAAPPRAGYLAFAVTGGATPVREIRVDAAHRARERCAGASPSANSGLLPGAMPRAARVSWLPHGQGHRKAHPPALADLVPDGRAAAGLGARDPPGRRGLRADDQRRGVQPALLRRPRRALLARASS